MIFRTIESTGWRGSNQLPDSPKFLIRTEEAGMVRRSLIINPRDTVAVLLENARKGDTVETPCGPVVLLEDIEFAHKVAIVDYDPKQPVYKYGHKIGYMEKATPKGTWIHNHNMYCDRGR
jgi:hypothetical protein